MKISLEEKKAEAVKRMKAYGLFHEAIECFEHDGIVMYSEAPWGCYYAVDDNLKKEINKFEKEHNALVYTVVRSYHRELGMRDSLLYVSDEKMNGGWTGTISKTNVLALRLSITTILILQRLAQLV